MSLAKCQLHNRHEKFLSALSAAEPLLILEHSRLLRTASRLLSSLQTSTLLVSSAIRTASQRPCGGDLLQLREHQPQGQSHNSINLTQTRSGTEWLHFMFLLIVPVHLFIKKICINREHEITAKAKQTLFLDSLFCRY